MKKTIVCSLIVMLMLVAAVQADIVEDFSIGNATKVFVDTSGGPVSTLGLITRPDGWGGNFSFGGYSTEAEGGNPPRYRQQNIHRWDPLSYYLTVFDSTGGNIANQIVALTGVTIASTNGNDIRHLVRNACNGDWYASDVVPMGIDDGAGGKIGYLLDVTTVSWYLLPETAAINDAITNGTATFPATLTFTASPTSCPTNVDGGGLYHSAGAPGTKGWTWHGDAGSCGGPNAAPAVTPTADPTSVYVRTTSGTSALTLGYFDSEGDALDTGSITWSVVSGPDVPAIDTSVSAENPTITLPVGAVGDYVINAEAAALTGDTTLVNADVTITTVDNLPPNANIRSNSSNKTIYYDETLVMESSPIEDDSDPCAVTFFWEVTAGTASDIEFQDPCGVPDPTVAWPTVVYVGAMPTAPQVYAIKLTVYDNETVGTTGPLSASETTNLTVIANIDPTAEAGDPTAFITLAAPDFGILDLSGAVATDADEYPKPYTFTVTWQADDVLVDLSDPCFADFNTAGPGEYVLTLTADDGGGNPAVDTIVVTVSQYAMGSVTFEPIDDTFVRKNREGWNMGTENKLRAAAISNNGTCYPYLKFDVYGNVPGAVESATLSMKTQEAFVETRVSAVTYGLTGEWFEGNGDNEGNSGGITWDTDDLVWGGELDFVAPALAETRYSFDVSAMQLEYDGKATFGLKADLEGSDSNNDWRAKEESNVADRPTLTIAYQTSAAYSLQPVQTATEVHPNAIITWNAGVGSDSEEVWFEGGLVATNTVGVDPNEYDPSPAGELALGTTYTYQIKSFDGVDQIGETAVHSFTVMALHPDIPVNAAPTDDSVDLARVVTFDFFEGEDANSTGDHDLLIGEISGSLSEAVDGILPGWPNATVEVDGLGTEYFWQIRAVGTGGTYESDEWSFTTENCETIDDFEAGVWPGGVANTVTKIGTQSMAISYAASAPGAATLTFAGGKDFDALNAGLLHIQFHGAIGNDADLLTVTLDDGVNLETVTYDGDAIDIIRESYAQWQDWYIDLGLFADAGVILSSVDTLTIGIGDGSNAGVVYIDDVLVCAPMCLNGQIDGQFNGEDCMGDPNELILLARDWLLTTDTISAGGDTTSDLLVHFTFESIEDPNGNPGDNDDYFVNYGSDASVGMNIGIVALDTMGPAGFGNAADCADGLVQLDDVSGINTAVEAADAITYAFWAFTEVTIDPATGKFDVSDSRFVTGGGSDLYWKFRSDGVYAVNGMGGQFVSNAYGADDISKIIGVWNHHAYVADIGAGESKLYVNGVLVASPTNVDVDVFKPLAVLKIGNRNAGTNPVKIDDFRLYNRALTQSEILSLAGLGPVTQEVVSGADTNGDGTVNLADFANVAAIWMQEGIVWP